jgi:hypothetical protein
VLLMIRVRSVSCLRLTAAGGLAVAVVALVGCRRQAPGAPKPGAVLRAVHRTPLVELNDGPCKPGQRYVQEPLREPMKIGAAGDLLETELVVAITDVAKEFTGAFVNHCHILGHEDRGMMHNTQAVCADGQWAKTGPVPRGAACGADGFCPDDCQLGARLPATPACAAPPPQQSDWPSQYGVK